MMEMSDQFNKFTTNTKKVQHQNFLSNNGQSFFNDILIVASAHTC